VFWKINKKSQIKLFVSIGAGLNQIPLIEEAKNLGYHVIGVDVNSNAPGFMKCDIKIQESVENYNEIYIILRELLIDGEIRGVLSKSFGTSIKTACYIANKLNIPAIPYERVEDFIKKNRMKNIYKKFNIESPKFWVVNETGGIEKIIDKNYPVIIKPAVGHAKKNVKLIENYSDMKNYLADVPFKGAEFLIENYVDGDEIIAVGIVYKNKYHLVDITDKILTPPPHFVDLIHVSPSKYYHLAGRISEIGQKVAEAFEIYTYPLIMELRVTKDEKIFMIESVAEFGGEFISDVLIPARTGYNFIRETIKAAAGENFNPPSARTSVNCSVVKYITGSNGTLMSFNPENPRKKANIVFARIFKNIGSEIRFPKTNHDRIGVVVANGKSRDEALDNAEQAIESYNIRIKGGSNSK
jgi:biotin carboxylase